MPAHLVYIGLGSNLANPVEQIKKAFDALALLPKTRVIKHSQLYASKPQGPQDQPDFVNAVSLIETELEPLDLLDALQGIEQQHGKVKKRHWGERLIDLDILLYGDQVIDSERLTVPHKEMTHRDFVLLPLADVSAGLLVSNLGSVEALIQNLESTYVVPMSSFSVA